MVQNNNPVRMIVPSTPVLLTRLLYLLCIAIVVAACSSSNTSDEEEVAYNFGESSAVIAGTNNAEKSSAEAPSSDDATDQLQAVPVEGSVFFQETTEKKVAAKPPLPIRIATEGNIPPFSNTRNDGTLYGLDIDLGQALCKLLNFACEWFILDKQSLFPALNANKVDMVISAIPVTRHYQDKVLVSEPYLGYQPGLLVQANFPIESYSINDITVGLIADTPMQRYVHRNFFNVRLIDYPDMKTALAGLHGDKIQGIFHDSLFLNQYVGYDKTLYLLDMDDHFNQRVKGYGVAVRKRRFDLAGKVRAGITVLEEEAFFEKLEEHARRQPKKIKRKAPAAE